MTYNNEDLGLAGVRRITEFLSIDEEWSMPMHRGVAWWAKDFQQRIWAEEGIEDGGVALWRIHVATDFLTGFDLDRKETRAWLSAMLPFATQYAWVHESEKGLLRLWSSLWVHADTFSRRVSDLATSATFQITDAQLRAPMLASQFGETAHISAHPRSGRRAVADEILDVVEAVFVPSGKESCTWEGADEFEDTVATFNERGGGYGNGDPTGLTLEFPFGEETSMLQMLTDQGNPQLGSGLLQLLHIPKSFRSQQECLSIVMQLNRQETLELTRSPLLGSWCASERDGEWIPVFVSFRPNVLRKHGDIQDLAISQAIRARWVSSKLASVADQPASTTVMNRLMKFLGARK